MPSNIMCVSVVIGILAVCLQGVQSLSCADCSTITHSDCGYWYKHQTGYTTECTNGTCEITKGTYQGTEFYERKCFQGNLQACEQKSDFVWHGDFQIEYRVCCNSSNFCNNSNIISGQFYVILLATMALFLFGYV